MRTREEAVSYCLKMPDVFEDYPFHDPEKEIYRMIEESYDLVRGKKSTRRT